MKEIELIGKRNLREKHFLQEDGTILAKVYDNDIHYLKNGKYEEIDNTLILKDGYYTNKSNDYKVFFQEEGKNSLVKMQKDNFYLDMKLEKANNSTMETKTFDSKIVEDIIYKDILKDVNIEYRTLSNKVKETIVMKTNSYKNFSFVVDTNLVLNIENGEILARNDNDIIFKIDKPYMEDASGKSNMNIYYQLNVENNKYKIELILDSDWLNSIERKFPIYIDPTITSDSDTSSLQDTYIYPGDTGVNKGTQDILKAGVEKINGSDRINRTLIKFDLPRIGTGSEIVNASLNLTSYLTTRDAPIETEKLATVHRITQDWSESTASWNNMNNKFDSHIESIIPCSRSYLSNMLIMPVLTGADLTKLVRRWYRDLPNYGIMIKSSNEAYIDEDYPAFYSKNNNVYGDPKPIFSITYRNLNGLENYLNYKVQAFTNGKTYINTYTGNMTGIFNIGHTIGGQLPASVNLVYNTNDVVLDNKTKFGLGFKINLDQKIKETTINNTNYLEYSDEDGTLHYFLQKSYKYPLEINEENIYVDEDGLNLEIEKQDTQCIMTDKNGNKMIFTKLDNVFYLTKIEDINENSISIIHNDEKNITKIIDSNNLEINIQYNTNNIIISSDNATTTLNYNNNSLTSIATIDGITSFAYNENNIITSITDVNGMSVEYEYYAESPYKAKKTLSYGLHDTLGKTLTFQYDYFSTKVIDNKGKVENIISNEFGNVLSQNNLSTDNILRDAYSSSIEYGTRFNNENNKIKSNTIAMKYIKNYLKNTYFENDDDYFTVTSGITKSFDTEVKHIGTRSLKIESNLENQYIEQEISVEKGMHYTFSGYFKTDDQFTITLLYNDEFGNTISQSETINGNGLFTREDVSIYYDNTATSNLKIRIELSSTTIYIDAIQLEIGEVANAYNMVENSDFSDGLNGWTCSARHIDANAGTATEIDINSKFGIIALDNQNALKVKMDPETSSFLTKTFPIKGKKDEIYNISFWYKNEGVAQYRPHMGCVLSIFFDPTDGDISYCLPELQLNRNDENWQFYTYRYKATEDFESITFSINQIMNANNFYITNVSFYKEMTSGDFSYDESGNLLTINNQSQEQQIFKYDVNNQLINATSPKGKNFKYEYDNDKTDRLLSAISDSGISNEIRYDSYGNPITTKISKKNPNNIVDGEYRIRSKGTQKYLKAELNNIFLEESECSNTIWNIEKMDNTYKLKYAILPSYSISYNSNNDVVLSTNDTNNIFVLERKNNASYNIVAIGEKEERKYVKTDGTILRIDDYIEDDPTYEFYIEYVNNMFIENDAAYSQDGRFLEKVTDSNLKSTYYDTDSTTGLLQSITDEDGNVTSYQYNDKNMLKSITIGDKVVNYSYNEQNLLEKISLDNKEYNVTYDDFLNIKHVKLGDSINLIENEYESNNGNLISTKYANNQTISFDYDSFDRIKKITKNDDEYNYKYSDHGNVSKIISNNNTKKYKYDVSNRLYEYKDNDLKINYTYDNDNNVTNKTIGITDTFNTIHNTFNEDDILTSVSFDNDIISYEHDSLDRLKEKKINNQYQVEYKYKSLGKRATLLLSSIKNGDNTFEYNYDNLSNISNVYYNNNLQNKYLYNKYNELINEKDYFNNLETNYTYDLNGNILSKVKSALITDEIIKTDTYLYENNDWKDQLTKYNDINISYDNAGNPISIGDYITLTWKNGKELSTYSDSLNNINISYKYNESGIRTNKIINGIETKYYLEGNKIIYEKTGNNTLYYLRDAEGLVGFRYNNETYYYIKNAQEDIIGILDSNYNKIVEYSYDSWGNILNISDTSSNNIGKINPIRYRSYYYDEEIKFYYLNHRYYNPLWGRFINADSSFGMNSDHNSYNLYTYCSNNPINNGDPSGQSFISFIRLPQKAVRKVVQKVANTVKNVVNNVGKAISNGVKTVTKAVTSTLSNMFTYSYGTGLGYDYDIGMAGFSFSSTTSGKKMENGEVSSYDSGEISYSFLYLFTVSKTYENNDMLQNPTLSFFNLCGHLFSGNDDGIVTEYQIGKDFVISFDPASKKLFVGLDYDEALFVAGKISAGFQFVLPHDSSGGRF